jgi:hypothetical protein
MVTMRTTRLRYLAAILIAPNPGHGMVCRDRRKFSSTTTCYPQPNGRVRPTADVQ